MALIIVMHGCLSSDFVFQTGRACLQGLSVFHSKSKNRVNQSVFGA